MIVNITEAILRLAPNASFSVGNESVDEITWLSDDIQQPSNQEILDKLAEMQAAEPLRLLREERSRLIAETDWWASSDLTMTAEQAAYRQALRDITDTYQSLDTVVWPDKPE